MPTLDSPILVHAHSGSRSERQSNMRFVVRSSESHLHGLPLLPILAHNHPILLAGVLAMPELSSIEDQTTIPMVVGHKAATSLLGSSLSHSLFTLAVNLLLHCIYLIWIAFLVIIIIVKSFHILKTSHTGNQLYRGITHYFAILSIILGFKTTFLNRNINWYNVSVFLLKSHYNPTRYYTRIVSPHGITVLYAGYFIAN